MLTESRALAMKMSADVSLTCEQSVDAHPHPDQEVWVVTPLGEYPHSTSTAICFPSHALSWAPKMRAPCWRTDAGPEHTSGLQSPPPTPAKTPCGR